MKGLLEIDNAITRKVDRYKYGLFLFVNIIRGLKISILGCMFSEIDFVQTPHEGWMKNGSLFAQKFVT